MHHDLYRSDILDRACLCLHIALPGPVNPALRPFLAGTALMRRISALLATLVLALGGCATWPDRIAHTAIEAEQASVRGFPAIRYWADADAAVFDAMRAAMARQAPSTRPGAFLAISGGSDNGAYGAGFLKGWSETGKRPEFTIVSGVSTGALIAPFAFLGPEYDDRLRGFYTGVTRKDIYRQRGVVGLLTQPSIADTAPLAALIAQNIDEPLLDAIAQEHRKGRRLLVQTTNLDAARGVVWDMGAIAQSTDPRRLELFRRVLLASASIPGLFAPVMIEVADGGRIFREMHVDGSATAGFLAIPESVLSRGGSEGQQSRDQIFVILNGRLRPEYELVEPATFAIVSRALATVLSAHDRASLLNVQNFARDNGIAFRISYIGPEFALETEERFSQAYMHELFDYGRLRGRESAWAGSISDTGEEPGS
ncbi:MAG: patatin-like phospholipase family protein [Alphaproteobacteria bacterium]|nr:patatin-like phospholipase family protein [Alphaproteobacteria bacterium]